MKFSPKLALLILSVIVLVALGTFGVFSVLFKTSEPDRSAKPAEHGHPAVTAPGQTHATAIAEALPEYDVNALNQQVERDCPTNNLACLNTALLAITEKSGPKASLLVLRSFQEQGRIGALTDDHHLAHDIGRKTAERFGVNGRAFLLCPTTFNYGCQHGFFQYALAQAQATDSAARLICGSLGESYSSKFRFYCYHGVGHGVMMAQNYNLAKALAACDTLETTVGQNGCWQGVFMENVNASRKEKRPPDGFSRSNPLAPCNVVPDKYQSECFINHAGWLMKIFNNDVTKATKACLRAPEAYVSLCLQSIGLMVTNPAWQPYLAQSNGEKEGKPPEVMAWDLCRRFPKDHRAPCVIGAIDNILNFDEFEVSRARTFCNTVDAAYRNVCYHQIGVGLMHQATNPDVVRHKCATFEGYDKDECLQGAGV
ncbi:MAG TPA: hypothetical protein VGQ07_01810 [Nitrospirales bacterium]|jgi:hypothetical protein|nr:hypothetical protein [Nitrospirales bacterium]